MTTLLTGVNGGTFPNQCTGPADGEFVTAASVNNGLQGVLNECKYLYDTKLDLAGGTMTGALIVTAAAASGDAGITTTGDGGAAGLVATGGSSAGTGITATGGTGGNGLSATGEGAGTGVVATGGSTGVGLYCIGGGGAAALQVAAGHAIFTGTQPTSTADPGQDNLLCGTNIPKAWGWVKANNTASPAMADAYNVASVAISSSSNFLITFARAMSSADYAVTVTEDEYTSQTELWMAYVHDKTTTSFKIGVYTIGTSGGFAYAAANIAAEDMAFSFAVFARQ